MKQLRDPQTGCEWDRVQTFESIKPNTLEETYEVFDAIDQKNYAELKNELGDLLFQIIFYSELADEQQLFNFNSVSQALNEKLIHRHPHIFNQDQSGQTATDKANWEAVKQREREEKQQFSVLDDIPQSLPALMRAEKVQKRCASVGFDWQTLPPVIDKINEELEEVLDEINRQETIQDKIEEEVGDLLFAVVNLARHLKLNPELTLQKATQKFENRFRQIENHFKQQHISLTDASLDEMEQVWQTVKQLEK